MNRKNKLAIRITAIVLCIAMILTAANWNDVIKLFTRDIAATEEQLEQKVSGNEIVKFNNDEIKVNLNTAKGLSDINDYLPKKINVTLDNGEEKDLNINNWSFYSGGNLKDGKYSYLYEMEIPDGYTVKDGVSTPLASVYIKEAEIKKDMLVDNGVYSIEAKAKEEVCSECFRELDKDGLCNKCHKEKCECNEIDIDLQNMNSINAFCKKYIKNFNGFIAYKDVYEFDINWIKSLPKNKREVVDTLCRYAYFCAYPSFCSYINFLTVDEFLNFIDNNLIGFTFDDYKKEFSLNITLSQLKELGEANSNTKMKDIIFNISCMMNDFEPEEIINNKQKEILNKVVSQTKVREKFSSLYNTESTNFSSLKTENMYAAARQKYSALGKNTKARLKTDKEIPNIFGRYCLQGKNGDSTKVVSFCGDHSKGFKEDVYEFNREYKIGTIGSVTNYIYYNYPNLSNPEVGQSPLVEDLYTIAQSAIWNKIHSQEKPEYHIDTPNDPAWSSQGGFAGNCKNLQVFSEQSACALWWVFRFGGKIHENGVVETTHIPDSNDTKIVYTTANFNSNNKVTLKSKKSETISLKNENASEINDDDMFELWTQSDDSKQPMIVPSIMDYPSISHVQDNKEYIRSKMVVRHNINNYIDPTTGQGVIAKWDPKRNSSVGTIQYNTSTGDIKNGHYALYYASNQWDSDNITEADNDINKWKSNNNYVSQDTLSVEDDGTTSVERYYITPFAYNDTFTFINYKYEKNDNKNPINDLAEMIDRHTKDKDDSDESCNAYSCKKNRNLFSEKREVAFLPYSSHVNECLSSYVETYTAIKTSSKGKYSLGNQKISSDGFVKDTNDEPEDKVAQDAIHYSDSLLDGAIGIETPFAVNMFGNIAILHSYVSFYNNCYQYVVEDRLKNSSKKPGAFSVLDSKGKETTRSKEEKIYKPETLKYNLVLHYQGGYLKYPDKIATRNKQESYETRTFITPGQTNDDASYKMTIDKGRYKDVVTKETVGSRFTNMALTHYTIDPISLNSNASSYTDDANVVPFNNQDGNPENYTKKKENNYEYTKRRSRSELSDPRENWPKLSENTNDNYQTFTVGKVDGHESVVDFNYEGDYVASLPKPSRYGYNFLGWYTRPNMEGSQLISTSIPGYGDGAVVLDNNKMSNYGKDPVDGMNTTLELYAAWELITKDETFFIDWMDNDNKYATRPDTVYVQLYRRTNHVKPEQVTNFITEKIDANRFVNGDWVTRYSNETGLNNQGNTISQEEALYNYTDSHGGSNYKFGQTASNIVMNDPNNYIYLGHDVTGAEQYVPNPYHSFNGDGNFAQTAYMKVSLYKDKNSTSSSGGEKQIDITGDNNSPATSNKWEFTLRNLQKFKTYVYGDATSPWEEYQYTIKQIHTISKDYTIRYLTIPTNTNPVLNKGNRYAYKETGDGAATTDDDSQARYGSRLRNYYSMDARSTLDAGNSNSRAITKNSKDEYNAIPDSEFGNGVINRIANIYDEPEETNGKTLTEAQKIAHTFKTVSGTITFVDGMDKFHFRPYSMVVDLYQNTSSNRGGETSNDLSPTGVREIIQSQPIIRGTVNPYSSINPGELNVLNYEFKHVPTLQEETGIKYGYDVVLTHNQKRYRYTINTNDASDNFYGNVASNECYSYVHRTFESIPIDQVYSGIEANGNAAVSNGEKNNLPNDSRSFLPIYQSLTYSNYTITSQSNADKKYEGLLTHVSPTGISNNSKINQYAKNSSTTYGANTYMEKTAQSMQYLDPYKSMAYNLRYYYISEGYSTSSYLEVNDYPSSNNDRDKNIPNGDSTIDYYYNISVPEAQQDKEVQYKEHLNWNFTVTLQGNEEKTTLPTEYTGSESPDDRSGVYTGNYNSDFTHTRNRVIIKSNIFADDKNLNSAGNNYTKTKKYNSKTTENDYTRLAAYKECEGFLLTFRQVKKEWTGSGDNVKEVYKNNESPNNGKRINTYKNNTTLLDQHMSFTDIVASDKAGSSDTAYEVTAVGNEYNVIIPAEGQTEMMYLPDGKYEITCHEDIDFHSISFIDSDNGSKMTSLEEDNGRWFITFSSTSNENKNSVNEFLDSRRTNTSNVTGNSEIDWWRGYDDDAANIAFDKVTGKEIDQTFNNNVMRNGSSTYGVDSINPFTATHGPTAKVKGYDNLNYNKYNNVTKNSGASQYNGFQVNTWRDRSADKTKQPLQYNNYVLSVAPKTSYGYTDKNAFSITHNYDAFYIGSHSWAEVKDNLTGRNHNYEYTDPAEYGQEPNGIGPSDGNHLYKGTPGTNSTRPKVTGPNLPYSKADNWTETSGNRFNYTGIIENWKSSTAQSNTNGTYTKPATK